MFKLLGVLVALYTLAAATKGEVYAKSGVWGRTVSKQDEPRYFWSIIVIYASLSFALLTIF
jgi:hypothetical protein